MILTLFYYIKAPVLPHYSKYRESEAETHDGGLSDYFINTVHRFLQVYHTSLQIENHALAE